MGARPIQSAIGGGAGLTRPANRRRPASLPEQADSGRVQPRVTVVAELRATAMAAAMAATTAERAVLVRSGRASGRAGGRILRGDGPGGDSGRAARPVAAGGGVPLAAARRGARRAEAASRHPQGNATDAAAARARCPRRHPAGAPGLVSASAPPGARCWESCLQGEPGPQPRVHDQVTPSL